MLDFVQPELARIVKKAMHHPLFQETSRLTILVQKHLMARESTSKPETEEFVRKYAGVVSYILATILLTRQSSFPVDLACRRVQIIHRLIGELYVQCSKVNQDVAVVFRKASTLLISKLEDFASTFQP